jgi:DNA replication protein DnaC
MISDETYRKLREMNMSEMVDALKDGENLNTFVNLTFDESMKIIIDQAYSTKSTNKINRLIKNAKFRYKDADLREIIYEDRDIERQIVLEVSNLGFLANKTNLILEGFAGCGKTWLGCALGKQACKLSKKTKYVRLPDLLQELDIKSQMLTGKQRLINQYSNCEVLIIDEWLLTKMSGDEMRFIFEIMERRSGNYSTIFCTLYKENEWFKRLGENTLANSLVDRIVNNKITIKVGSTNMRKRLNQ